MAPWEAVHISGFVIGSWGMRCCGPVLSPMCHCGRWRKRLVLISILQRNRTDIQRYRERLIMKDWLMRLWKLKSPMTCPGKLVGGSSLNWKPRVPENQCCNSQSESEDLRTKSTEIQGQEKMVVPASQKATPSLAFLFYAGP